MLQVNGVAKSEGGRSVLTGITFSLTAGEKLAIAGGTGSGKTTLLKIMAGLVQPDEGEVLFDQVRVEGPSEKLLPGHPRIAYLSQHFELRNNYTVREILEYARLVTTQEAMHIHQVCRISHLLSRKTNELSGGERQRIALARLLVTGPSLLLLDEPFSNLDFIHKSGLKEVIREFSHQLKITCLLVSHDPMDVLSWADRILVLAEGQVRADGSPSQLYHEPPDEYVAALFGKYNLLPAKLYDQLNGSSQGCHNGKKIFTRPEDLRVDEEGAADRRATITAVHFLGSGSEWEVMIENEALTVKGTLAHARPGDEVYLSLVPRKAWTL